MRAEQWCNSCGIAYWKLHSYPRSPSGPVLLAWMQKELQNELPFCYQVLPIGSTLPSVSFGGCQVAEVRTWASERWVKGKFYAAASPASLLKKFSHLPSCHRTRKKGRNRERFARDWGKETLFPLGEGVSPFVDQPYKTWRQIIAKHCLETRLWKLSGSFKAPAAFSVF